MAKLKPNEKRVQLSFQRPEDLRLFSFMEREAYRCRWELPTFILASLTEAFKDRMEEDEVESIAAEAAQKVRERKDPAMVLANGTANKLLSGETQWVLPESESGKFVPAQREITEVKGIPAPVSMERALNDAEAQIAALDAVAAKTMGKRVVRKGVPSPPPLPR